MKFVLFILLGIFFVDVCRGQSKPLDLSVTLSDLNNYQALSDKGQANGYTPLNSNSLVPPSFLFPGFSSSQDGTIWSKSGNSWLAISNLTVQPFSLVISLARIGKLNPPGISLDIYGIGTELSTIPLVLYGGNSRVYIANGQTIGGANVNFNNFTWSINSSGNFDLNSGIIKNGLSLNNTSISNISSIFASSGLSINFTNNRITSLQSGKDIIFVGDNFGVQVPNIDTNNLLNPSASEITKNYALNVRSADLLYVAKNSSNNWTLPQVFSGGITISPSLSISSGGTGATNAAQARQNLGITTGVTGGFQAWSPVLSSLASNAPTTNNFLVGVSSAWVSRTPAQVRSILGIEVGAGGLQPYSETLNYISTIVTNNSFGSKYIFVGDPVTKTLTARTAALARSDLGLEINSTNGVQAYSVYLRDISILGVPQVDEFLVGNGTTWTKKNPSQTRLSLGLGATWLTNTNVTNFRTAIGLGTENDVEFKSIQFGYNVNQVYGWQWNADGLFYFIDGEFSAYPIEFEVITANSGNIKYNWPISFDTNIAAITRTNLGLGATWLTNTNVTNFRTAIGLGATNNVQFRQVDVLTLFVDEGGSGITFNDASVAAATRTNLGVPLIALTNTNNANFRAAIELGGFWSEEGWANLYDASTNLVLSVEDGVEIYRDLRFGGTNAAINAATTRTNLGLGATNNVTFNSISVSNAAVSRTNLGLGGGINETKTFVSADDITNTVVISNGIITSWTQD